MERNKGVGPTPGDENLFRAPLPPSVLKKKEMKTPLKARNVPAVAISQVSISPGTSATEEKKAAMLAKLEKRRSAFKAKWAQDKESSTQKSIDVEATERSFLEQSFDEPPPPRFSDVSSICPSENTFLVTTPRRNDGPVCSTPFRKHSNASPRTTRSTTSTTPLPQQVTSSTLFNQSATFESLEDITDRQFDALSVWCNMLLNTCNRFEDGIVDLGKTKQEATKKLQELLNKQGKEANTEESARFTYTQFLERQQFETLRVKAQSVYRSSDVPQKILSMVQHGTVSIRDGLNVYSDISLKTTLLQMFLSFHPVWLHLGMETVFREPINIDGASFLATMSRFINTRVFSDPQMMRLKKYAVGSVKLLVTPAGREALHRHFLTKTLEFLYCVEVCKTAGVIPSDPRMFTKKANFKSLPDVFSELSREALSGMPLPKAFIKSGFQPTYKQSYFDNLEYKISSPTDLCDGVMLGKLVEVVCVLGRSAVMSKLRNPGGDRLRKIGNVAAVIECATKAGVDCGNVKPEAVVGGNREAILELLWRLVGVFVLSSGGSSDELRRESLRLHFDCDRLRGEGLKPEDFLLHMCQQLGFALGEEVKTLEDLRDGKLLSTIWRTYNPHGSEIHFYPGSSLFKKVVAAAESELGLPVGLHGALPLFVHMFLTRIFNIRRLNEAASRIQRAYRSFRFFKRLRAHLASDEYAAEKAERDRSISLAEATYTITSVREGEARKAFEEMLKEQREKAAVIIQTTIRAFLARRQVARMRAEEQERQEEEERLRAVEEEKRQEEERLRAVEEEKRNRAAARIQRAFRVYAAKKKVSALREDRERYLKNVVLVQAICRGFIARRHYALLNVEKLAKEEEERRIQREKEEQERRIQEERRLQAVLRVQSQFRGILARRCYAILKAEKFAKEEEERRVQREREEQEKRFQNIVVLQSHIRRHLAQKRYRAEKERIAAEKEKERLAQVVLVQTAVRGFLARRRYLKMKEEEEQRKQEEERRRIQKEEQLRRVQQIIRAQATVRGFLARRRYLKMKEEEEHRKQEEERRIQREEQERILLAVITIQSHIRRFLARKRYMVEKERIDAERERKRLAQVVLCQTAVRGFLARRRMGDALNERIAKVEAQEEADVVTEETEPVPSTSRTPSRSELMAKLRYLYVETKRLKARQASCEQLLSVAKKAKALQDKESSAKKIQAWWRGCRVRREYRPQIEERHEAMDNYRQDMEHLGDDETRTPAMERLRKFEEQLFETSLYRVKVAATVINRLISLSPSLMIHFVIECGGLNAVLDRLEQCDRSPPMQEIVLLTSSILLKIVQAASERNEVAALVRAASRDILAVALHHFHAFYAKPEIVVNEVDIIIKTKSVDPTARNDKEPFYINQATNRFAKLSDNDVRKDALHRLRVALG